MQSAADTAALAAARAVQTGQAASRPQWGRIRKNAEKVAASMFKATLAAGGSSASRARPKVTVTQASVAVSSELEVKTSFLAVLGINSLKAAAHAEVGIPDPINVEIALVLDYSRSMLDNDKYIRMTAAARNFIARIGAEKAERTKIGIVPFSEYVYATMLGRDIRGSAAGSANKPVTACLVNRDFPYSASDETPLNTVEASRWPAADPASPECQAYPANKLRVQDLTSDYDGLGDALAQMQPANLTNIALATEMGWHMLSPNRPFETARDYSDPMVKKILILLTDGVQTVNAHGPGGDVSTQAADETTAELCRAMKAEGVRVFTIAYDIEEQRVHDLLSNCSGPAGFHEAKESTDISAVFDDIYSQIAESVWLSR
jgi:hypothetical protein